MNLALKALTLAGYFVVAIASEPEANPIVTDPQTKVSVERDLKQAGENCLTSVDVDCVLPDGRSCDYLYDISLEECGMTELKYTYTWKNLNSNNSIKLFPNLTTPKLQNKVLVNFNKSMMTPNEERTKIVYRTIDTCIRGRANASMKLEGWVAGFRDQNDVVQEGYYCFAWKFLRVLIRQNTPEPTPIVEPIVQPPNLNLDITCRYKSPSSGVFNAPCSSLVNFIIINTQYRMIEVEYIYTITNMDDYQRSVTLQGLISDGENLLPINGGAIKLNYGQMYILGRQYEIIDLTRPLGYGVASKKAIAIGTAGDDLTPGYASDEISYSLPNIPVALDWGYPQVKCIYQGIPCQEYIDTYGCFTGEAVFHYRFQNTGFVCNTVSQVEAIFGAGSPLSLALDGDYSCADRNICPGDVFALKQYKVINSCSIPFPTRIVLQITTTTVTTTITTTWGLTPPQNPINPPTPPVVPPPTHPVAPPTPPPQEPINPVGPPVHPPQQPINPVGPPTPSSLIGTQCDSRPSKVWFMFTGDACPSRRLKHNGNSGKSSGENKAKHQCNQVGDMGGGDFSIIIKGKNSYSQYANQKINVGRTILIQDSKLPTNTFVEVYSGPNNVLVQTMTIHTSCSGTFEIGQSFGAVKVHGFETQYQGVVKLPDV